MATLPYCKATPYRAHVRGGQAILLAVGAPALNGTPPTVKIGGVNAPVLAWDMDQGTLVVRAPPGSGSPTVRIEHALLDGGHQDFSGVLDYVSSLRKLYPASLTASVAAPAHPGAAAGWIIGTGQTPQKVGAAAPVALANGLSANAILLPECVPADQVTRSGLGGAPSAGGAFSNYAESNGPFLQGQFVTFPLYGVTSIPAGTWRFRGASCTWFGLYGSQGDQLCIFIRHMDGTVTTVLDTSTEAARRAYTISSSYVWRTVGYDITLPQIALQDGDQIGFEWWGRNYSASTGQWAYFSMDGNATPDLSPLADGAVAGSDGSARPAAFIELPADLYEIPLSITSITPSSGPTLGGTAVTISGSGFTDATGATIGGVALTSFVVVNDTTITGVTGAHAAGVVDVVVTVGAETATLASGYTYLDSLAISPSHGPASGGTAVTLTGNGWFASGAVVTVGGGAVAAAVQSASAITFTAPAHSAGPVVVSVTSQGITKTATFTYDLVVTPNSGPDAGGTTVRVIGVAAGSPAFGGSAATNVSAFDWNSITCRTPAHAAGAVNVVVGALTAANAFTYLSTVPESDTTGCAPILDLGESTDAVGLDRLSSLSVAALCGGDIMIAGLRFPLAAAKLLFRRATMLVEELHRDAAGDPVGTWHVFEGEVQADASSSQVRFSVESFASKLKGDTIPRAPIAERCSNAFCDEACGLDASEVTVPAVSTVTGYRTTIATSSAAVLATTVGRFSGGAVTIASGPMAGQSRTILADTLYEGLRVLTLTAPLPGILGGGVSISLFPDCAKTPPACDGFGNLPRFRGQPFVPTDGQISETVPPTGIRGAPLRFVVITNISAGATTGSGFVSGVFDTIPLPGAPKAVLGATVTYTAGDTPTTTAANFTWSGGAAVEVERPAIDSSIAVEVALTCEWFGIEPQDLENIVMLDIFPAGGDVQVQAGVWVDSSGAQRDLDGTYRVAAVLPSAALLDGPEAVNAGWATAVLPSPYMTMAVVGV